jgi:hypothetical protein
MLENIRMSLLSESLIRICRGTRRLGGCRPVMVITGDTTDLNNPFAEYYIFHEFPDMSFLYCRSTCSHPDNLYLYDFGQYPNVFSAKALLNAQFRAAEDRLEHELSMRDRDLMSDFFFSALPPFQETDDTPLLEFAFFRRFVKERETMFSFSRSNAINLLKEKLAALPEADLKHEPKA